MNRSLNNPLSSLSPVSPREAEAQIARSIAAKQRTALIFGALAGAVFSAVAWGYDSLILATSHGMFAWLPFFLGLLPSAAVGVLASWVSYRINHILASFLIWLLAGVSVAWLTARISFQLYPWLVNLLSPQIGARLDYVFFRSIEVRNIIVMIAVSVLFVLAGLLSINLIETAAESAAPVGIIIPLTVWIALFAVAGYVPRDNYNQLFSQPVRGADTWVQFIIDNQGKTLPKELAASMRVRSAEPIQHLIQRPRRLILTSYDEWLSTAHVLIDFDGVPVDCWIIDNKVSTCKPVE